MTESANPPSVGLAGTLDGLGRACFDVVAALDQVGGLLLAGRLAEAWQGAVGALLGCYESIVALLEGAAGRLFG